ncbi:MAG: PspC domain-containing protein [Methanomassiliicoccales archaeon]|nr:PspC domain-containing protein [Methanomassiliicoccales archaeon]
MRYCNNCGHENMDDAQYCNNCGRSLKPDAYQQKEKGDFERRIDDFAQEMGALGKRVEKEFNSRGGDFESWSDSTLGILGPLIWSLIGLAFLVLIIGVMSLIGNSVQTFHDIADFLLANIWLIFALGLLFSYSNFFSRRYKEKFRWVQPIFTALGIVFGLWIASEIMFILATNFNIEFLETISSIMSTYLGVIFIVILAIGYVVFLISLMSSTGASMEARSSYNQPQRSYDFTSQGEYKRLYRSGRNRVLGGVCGGMGEYANLDPNIIRIIWIILLVVSLGIAILGYFICWIIIPRNPYDTWQ